MSGRTRAVFLDRDGVLNRYLPGDYAKTPEELELLPDIDTAVERLRDAGFRTILISNQQGVAKGLMSQSDLDLVTAKLTAAITLDGIYYCTHHKDDRCDCRKPLPGMLLRAAAEHSLDLATSYFVGDTPTDAQAARAAGVEFVLVLSGQTTDPAVISPTPTLIAKNLTDATAQILAESKKLR